MNTIENDDLGYDFKSKITIVCDDALISWTHIDNAFVMSVTQDQLADLERDPDWNHHDWFKNKVWDDLFGLDMCV